MIRARPTAAKQIGWWSSDGATPDLAPGALRRALRRLARPVHVVDVEGRLGVCSGGTATLGENPPLSGEAYPLVAFAPALTPEQLGDAGFRSQHGVRYAYVAGEMANAIGSEEIVSAMGRAGFIGFFGAAGCPPQRVEAAIERLQAELHDAPYGFNLIHSPAEPRLEEAVADLYIRRGVRLVCASAYLNLTLPLIRYRVSGIHEGPDGRVVTPNHVVAKVSRVEVARRLFAPPPAEMLAALVERGQISGAQARLAARIPVAQDLTAEADSGGHTDNRPAMALLPTMLALRDRAAAEHAFDRPLRVGLAGGIGTPAAAAGAFAMGAAYVLTGSINQACVEAGTSEAVRRMLSEAGQADVMMAPSADMFELGVNVQVLKRGTMFGLRARRLYEVYRTYESLEAIPPAERAVLERDIFREPLEQAWEGARAYFAQRDPAQIERAEREPRHKLALVLRSYLGRSSGWANSGDPTRVLDYQVWCGPAMGAFNEWARGSFLESPQRRDVVTVALNLMVGAAVLLRAGWLRAQGLRLPPDAERFEPAQPAELREMIE